MATSALCSQNTVKFVTDGGQPWLHLLLPCPGRSFQSGNALRPSLHHLVWGAVCVFSGNSPLSRSSSNGGHCVVLPARKHHELYHSHRGSAQEEPRCLPFSLKDGLPMAEAGPSICWKEEATWALSKKLSSDATVSPLDISSGDTGAVRAPAHVCCQLCMQLTLPELWIQMLVFCKYFFPFWLIFKMHFETQRVICFNYIWCVFVFVCVHMCMHVVVRGPVLGASRRGIMRADTFALLPGSETNIRSLTVCTLLAVLLLLLCKLICVVLSHAWCAPVVVALGSLSQEDW